MWNERGHKADRCWQKGKEGDWEKGERGSKGEGWSKGEWSNPGHTWDSFRYNSHWHGKTHGLEVDPWSAVEPVPYLCAVSLDTSCDEFSGPKRMTRGTRTTTSQPGSPKNFARVNKFSVLAHDDNEFTGEGCTLLHTSRQRKCGDERVDECITVSETKFSIHRGSGTSKLNAHQVSYQVETVEEFITWDILMAR